MKAKTKKKEVELAAIHPGTMKNARIVCATKGITLFDYVTEALEKENSKNGHKRDDKK